MCYYESRHYKLFEDWIGFDHTAIIINHNTFSKFPGRRSVAGMSSRSIIDIFERHSHLLTHTWLGVCTVPPFVPHGTGKRTTHFLTTGGGWIQTPLKTQNRTLNILKTFIDDHPDPGIKPTQASIKT